MLKQLLLLIVCFFSSSFLVAQINLGLWEQFHLQKIDNEAQVSLLFKGDEKDILHLLEENNATLKYFYNNVGSISLPKKYLNNFLLQLENIQIEVPVSSGHLMMDTALVHNNIIGIQQGLNPLTQAYTGKGVVVGILDSGIYFDHEDFKNPDGTTRIRFIWDQRANSIINPPAPYGYGQEWSWIDIDNGSCTHVEPANQFGHGTTVAGAACGNGLANGNFKGVASESEIIVVGIKTQENFLANVADAVDYVFKKADALGKPCVINTSLGTYFGSHDGKDLTSQLIEALLEERPGRAIVASAGNGNNIGDQDASYIPFHLGYNVTNDTSFTWFRRISTESVAYFDVWADTTDFNNVYFSIGNNNTTDFELISKTSFLNVKSDFFGDLEAGVQRNFNLFSNNGINQGLVEILVKRIDERYRIEFLITPQNNNDLWRFSTTGLGKFDVWSSQAFTGTSNMVHNNLPPDFILPEIINYKLADTKKTLVSSWQCSDKVITVGNFYNQGGYYDVDSIYRSTNNTPGEIGFRSSEGPTRDNKLKPDISATGDLVFASGNLTYIASALNSNRRKVGYGGLHNFNGGTSMSSPIVAGVVALYLEKNPNAWYYEVNQAIIQTAKLDSFTGPIPNTQYGNGKLDGFEVMLFDAVVGCTDTNAFNYNENANVEDGSCIPIVLGCTDNNSINFSEIANTDDGSCIPIITGCTDSLALNFNPLANVDNDSCQFEEPNSIASIGDLVGFNFYPNPMQDFCVVEIELASLQNKGDIKLVLYDVLGKIVVEKQLKSNQNSIFIEKNNIHNGIYLMRFEVNKKPISSTGKLIIQ